VQKIFLKSNFAYIFVVVIKEFIMARIYVAGCASGGTETVGSAIEWTSVDLMSPVWWV
jgi:hypothetical protein